MKIKDVKNVVKNKKKLLIVLAIVVAILTSILIVFYNINKENHEIELIAKIKDIEGKVNDQKVMLKAINNLNGTYSLELPSNVNKNYVTKFYTEDGNEKEVDSNKKTTITLTEEQIQSGNITLQTKYDTQEVSKDGTEETKTLYNKILDYNNGEFTVEGYMPLNSRLKVNEQEFTEEETENIENIENTSKLSIAVIETVETKNEETQETDIINQEFDPSEYGKTLTIKSSKDNKLLNATDDNNYTKSNENQITGKSGIVLLNRTRTLVGDGVQTGTTVKYAVQIYGINQDEDQYGTPLGLTFGPATGDNYNNKYVTHEYEETSTGSGIWKVKIITHTVTDAQGTETTTSEYLKNSSNADVTRTTEEKNKYNVNIHNMTWEQIRAVPDKTVFTDCMLCGDTKSVTLYLNDTIKKSSFIGVTQYGDGAGMLYDSVGDYYKKWNPSSSDNAAATNSGINGSNAGNAGGYSTSHIRATLIGANAKTDVTYAGNVNLTESTSLYSCIENSLKNVLTAKKVKYVTGTYTNNYSLNSDIVEKIWLLSEKEMYGTEGEASEVAYNKFTNLQSKYYIGNSYGNVAATNSRLIVDDGERVVRGSDFTCERLNVFLGPAG